MKRMETVEVNVCDLCQVNQAPEHVKCLGCGKTICYGCRDTRAKEYPHAVHFSGAGDGLYCLECDARLETNGDQLHAAYRKIGSLRNESKGWYENFKLRTNAVEADIERLRALNGESSKP